MVEPQSHRSEAVTTRGRKFLRGVAKPVLAANRQLVDARFVRQMGLDPSPSSRLLGPVMVLAGRVRRALRSAYDDDILARYVDLHSVHYGPGGRGYSSVRAASASEAHDKYASLVSRVEYFVNHFSDLLGYQDGDTFLDLGCGMGQNIRMLSHRFPNSQISGVDVSADAIEVIRQAETNSKVSTFVGDLLDAQLLDDMLAGRPDHIVVSHVFALLFASTTDETRKLRGELARRLASSCRKSVIILDDFGRRNRLDVSIEQLNRAVVLDDVLGYFADLDDVRAVLAYSPRSQAVICQHRPRSLG